MTPGELYWVEFPPANGHEQAGRRPAIVLLQDDSYARSVPMVFVVPVTGSLANLRFPATVRVDPSNANGLLKPSVVLVFQARAIDRHRIRGRIGVIEASVLSKLYATLDQLTGRP